MIKFTDAKDGTDVWVSDRAITSITRLGPDHCKLIVGVIDACWIVLGSAEEVVKKIEYERRFYGN